MLIKVFGPGCSKCAEAEATIRKAVAESGCAADVEKISDFKEMMANGVMSTPAVSIDGKLMCTGRAPTKKEAVEWIIDACKANGNCCN